MNSRDLYREVQVLYQKKGGSVDGTIPVENISFLDYSAMIYDYTARKLLEAGHQGDLVDDLGFLFDRLDEYFHSEKEKQSFYQIYVHCLLNYYNDISGEIALWEIKTEQIPGIDYPRFEKEQCITYFQTLEGESYKDTALWLWDTLKRVAEKPKDQEKGMAYQKERTLWNQ